MFGCVCATKANGDKSSKAVATARAQHLSDQMIKELRLNNYQARKVREINLQVAEQMTAIEQQYAGNQAKIEQLCKEACAERDVFLENVLSTVQYNDYFGDRKVYSASDKQFMANIVNGGQDTGGAVAAAETAVPNAPVSVN